MKSLVLCAAFSALLMARVEATEVDASSTDWTDFAGDASSSDLINGLTPSATNLTTPTGFDFPVSGINDGLATGSDNYQTYLGNGNNAFNQGDGGGNSLNGSPYVTFSLTGSATGYTLSSISSIYGFYNRASFADQGYTVKYTTVGDATLQTLAVVNYDAFDPANDGSSSAGSSHVVLTGLAGAVGVNSIQFDFTPVYGGGDAPQEQAGQLIQEIDVFGTATPVPEPSPWLMMLAGLGLLGFIARLQNS
jgi:hypothetical protein